MLPLKDNKMTDDLKTLPASAFRERIKGIYYRDLPVETGAYQLTPLAFNVFISDLTGIVLEKLAKKLSPNLTFSPDEIELAVTSALFFHNARVTVYADETAGHGRVLEFGHKFVTADTAFEILTGGSKIPKGWDKV